MMAGSRRGLRAASSKAMQFGDFGAPEHVLKEAQVDVNASSMKAGDVHVQMLAASVNPADIVDIEGWARESTAFPAVGGSAGVAKVLAVGNSVKDVKVGDIVVPNQAGFGAWREQAIAAADAVTVVPSSIPVEDAATIANGPSAAYRMLNDFAGLKSGDVVIQNAANSAVGQAVIQMAKSQGIKTVNIVRKHDEKSYKDTVSYLKGLGADAVGTQEEIASLVKSVGAPKLALNAVGGNSAMNVARTLVPNGTMVTYAGVSNEPVNLPTGDMIFKNVEVKGFSLNEWSKSASKADREAMVKDIATMVEKKQLKTNIERHEFSKFSGALASVANRTNSGKVVVTM